MTKVVYLPLDERPCNFEYPQQLAQMTDLILKYPEKDILGDKKQPGNRKKIQEWLLFETKNADYLILSIDMLVYGGIVPSRLHQQTIEESLQHLALIQKIKENNPKIVIYAFNLIMRAPAYSSAEEEPEYYEDFGEHIYKYGWLTDKKNGVELTKEEEEELASIIKHIPDNILSDFIKRRSVNAKLNEATIELVTENLIEHLIIPLDDNSRYGFSPQEQRQLIFKIDELNAMDQVSVYPGADEIGSTLFARVFCREKDYYPNVSLRYSSTHGPMIIPKYEDRTLNESIKSHLTAVGAINTGDSQNSDFILMVHSPAVGESQVAETSLPFHKRDRSYFSEVNIREFVQAMRYYIKQDKLVALADVATGNGGDHSLMKLLSKTGLLHQLEAYAGWNTSGNTIGTVIAHAVLESYYKKQPKQEEKRRKKSREFFYYRLVEDWGYQSIVRHDVNNNDLPLFGANYFNLNSSEVKIERLIEQKLNDFIESYLQQTKDERIEIENVYLPWKRMFEVGFRLELKHSR